MIATLAGLIAGSAHVLTGPDHLAAVAPLAVARPRAAAAVGARWGLGHGLGVAILGAVGLAFRHAVDLDAWSAFAEATVGFLLIAIGVWAWRRAARVVVHAHPHAGGDAAEPHTHLHAHIGLDAAAHDHPDPHREHTHAPLWIGALHGAAGAGHLFGVLPALALPPVDAALYLGAYLIAAIASMSAFAALLGVVARRSGPHLLGGLLRATSAVSIAVGGIWIALTLA